MHPPADGRTATGRQPPARLQPLIKLSLKPITQIDYGSKLSFREVTHLKTQNISVAASISGRGQEASWPQQWDRPGINPSPLVLSERHPGLGDVSGTLGPACLGSQK